MLTASAYFQNSQHLGGEFVIQGGPGNAQKLEWSVTALRAEANCKSLAVRLLWCRGTPVDI